jgi:hypothetical protein
MASSPRQAREVDHLPQSCSGHVWGLLLALCCEAPAVHSSNKDTRMHFPALINGRPADFPDTAANSQAFLQLC